MTLINVQIGEPGRLVPAGSSLGYVLLSASGAVLSPRVTTGIVLPDYPDGITAGLLGGIYQAQVDDLGGQAVAALFDTGGASPQTVTVSLLPPALPVLLTLTDAVGYTPNPLTAAMTVTQAGVTFGPFPAQATQDASGTWSLSASLTAIPVGLSAGSVSIQPGDLAGGVFSPIGGPLTGALGADASIQDIDILSVAGPFTDIDSQSSALVFGSTDFVHVGVSAQATTAGDFDVTKMQVDLLLGDLLTGTWQSAEWETGTDGSIYASLLVMASALIQTAGNWPSSLWYMVWVRITAGGESKIKRVGRLLILTS